MVRAGSRSPGSPSPAGRTGCRSLPAFLALLVLSTLTPAEERAACRSCAEARATNGWCDTHRVGYVASVPIRSERLHHAVDAHGHDVDPASFTCRSCVEALGRDGFCEAHRMGFVRKQAYFSRLTYLLARGEPAEPSTIGCAVCRKNAETHGWCERCKLGMAGATVIRDRREFDQLVAALARLHVANEAAQRCERCAVAIFTDTLCPVCRIRYADGKPVEQDP